MPATVSAATATAAQYASTFAADVIELDAQALLVLVNTERAKHGAPPLRLDATLSRASLLHSRDMAASGTASHRGSDGSSLLVRLQRQGITGAGVAEAVAGGHESTAETVTAWIHSPDHHRLMLGKGFKWVGYGVTGVYRSLTLSQ